MGPSGPLLQCIIAVVIAEQQQLLLQVMGAAHYCKQQITALQCSRRIALQYCKAVLQRLDVEANIAAQYLPQ